MNKTLILQVFLVVVILSGSGWLGYDLYTEKLVIVEKPEEEIQEETESTVESWQTYRNEELGIEFQYPDEWGKITKNRHQSEITFNAGFSNTATENGEYKITLYANSGKQDFTNHGRGGAEWDCVGFEKDNGGYSCKNI